MGLKNLKGGEEMATIIAFLALALLLTGAVTATAYAVPMVTGSNGDLTQNGDGTQERLRTRDCSGDMLQTQERMQLREREQDCNSTGNGPNGQGSPAENQYQNRLCEQVRSRVQSCFETGTNGVAP